jgi:hypothetical protein
MYTGKRKTKKTVFLEGYYMPEIHIINQEKIND